MLLLTSVLLCSGLFLFINTAKIDSSSFSFSSVPPRNVFLKSGKLPLPEFPSDHSSLKIVNGETAKPGQFCYQVFLIIEMNVNNTKQTYGCGGVVLNNKTVVTAAHCVFNATKVILFFGAVNMSKEYECGRLYIPVNSSGICTHENYDPRSLKNDIATIKLHKELELNGSICTIKLSKCSAKETDPKNKNYYTISGWGMTSDSNTTTVMHYANVSGDSHKNCSKSYKSMINYTLSESQLCTSGADGKSPCSGDSGGPLVYKGTLRGIVSARYGNCQSGNQSIFTDICWFFSWIKRHLS